MRFPRAPMIFTLAAASVIWPWLSLPALFFALIGALILPSSEERTRQKRITRLWLAASLTLVTVGLTRFVIHYAIVGIVQGGEQVVTGHAISRLRDILRWELAERSGEGGHTETSQLTRGPPGQSGPFRLEQPGPEQRQPPGLRWIYSFRHE